MNLDKIFYPRTIAVIGASDKLGSIGNSIYTNLSNQMVYPVNPNLSEINGVKCYPKIGDISEEIDLAVIAVPAKIVPIIVDEVAQKGIKNIIIISSGFKEAGRNDLEELVKLICQKNDINLLGPNCLGILNPETGLNASFAASVPSFGNVSLLSQSGAICTAIIDSAAKLGLGFSKFISLGNKTILGENEILRYLALDKNTSVVAVYTEQLSVPSELFNFPKPVIILKSGTTETGMLATKSHTGALAGNDSAYNALFKQSGTIRADTLSDFFNFQMVFSKNPLPGGNTLSIITNAGGVGVIAADAATNNSLVVDKVNDLFGDARAEQYRQALENISSNSVLVILTPQSVTEIDKTAQVIIDFKKNSNVPVVACFLGGTSVNSAISTLRQNNVCVIDFPEAAVRSIAALTNYSAFKNRSTSEVFEHFTDDSLPVIKKYLATTVEEATKIANEINATLVLKIASKDILHKSDVGGVVLNVDPKNIEKEYYDLIKHIKTTKPDAFIDGITIEEMVDTHNGIELIVGSFRDHSLGQTIMVGAGGIYTEILNDVAFGVVPITKTDAINMVNSLKIKKVLAGARGGQLYDIDAVVNCLGKLSQHLSNHPEIKEIDYNPVLVFPSGKGVKILDSRIITDN